MRFALRPALNLVSSAMKFVRPWTARLSVVAVLCATAVSATADDKLAVSQDVRFEPPKDLNGYFPFTPPSSTEAWAKRRDYVTRQTLVAQGLWPMPTKTPLNAVVHSPVERDDYTVYRVFFESVPGHFVCGSLYKPKGFRGKRPVVLCPHGHWKDARFHDAGEAAVAKQIADGAEKYQNSGRFFLQAKCATLARLGCIVFHYDMEGYSDAVQLSYDLVHRYGTKRPHMETAENWGFFSPQAELRAQSVMGLQTWNSIRALDFVASLDDVDASRIGVTGASGGGTQTFLLGICDSRPAAIVPAVMVSTAMQGGCTCENSTILRVETGNIELAGVFAPKPQALLAANDWTKEIMTKGYPELQHLYKLLGAPDNIEAHAYTQFPHNYNYVSRAAMYHFFNKHLKLGAKEPIVETDIEPLSIDELTVWSKDYPQPPAGDDHERKLVGQLTDDAEKQLAELTPTDSASLAEYRKVIGGAVDVILGRRLEQVSHIEQENLEETDRGDYVFYRCLLADKARGEIVPTAYYYPKQWNKQVVVWVEANGAGALADADGKPIEGVAKLIAKGYAVASPDLLGRGSHTAADFPADANRRVKNERLFAGFTYGYNHPLFAQRVHDILTVVAHARGHDDAPSRIHLAGFDEAGPIVAAAAAQCGDAVDRIVVDRAGFRFAKLTDYLDANFLPGIVKYGDLPALLALNAPRKMFLCGLEEPMNVPTLVKKTSDAAGSRGNVTLFRGEKPRHHAADWLTE